MKQTKPAQAMELRSVSPVFGGPRSIGVGLTKTMRRSVPSMIILAALLAGGCAHSGTVVAARQPDTSNGGRRGVPPFQILPMCSLSGDDRDGRARAETFLIDLHSSTEKSLRRVDFPPDFGSLAVMFEVLGETNPSRAHVTRAWIVESAPRMDAAIMRSLYQTELPGLL
jgi:hypothetical protein